VAWAARLLPIPATPHATIRLFIPCGSTEKNTSLMAAGKLC
jgi:hypothetical protein